MRVHLVRNLSAPFTPESRRVINRQKPARFVIQSGMSMFILNRPPVYVVIAG